MSVHECKAIDYVFQKLLFKNCTVADFHIWSPLGFDKNWKMTLKCMLFIYAQKQAPCGKVV